MTKKEALTEIIAEVAAFRDGIEGQSKDLSTGETNPVGMVKVRVLDELVMHLRKKFGIVTV